MQLNQRRPPVSNSVSASQLEAAIEAAWDARDQITPATKGEAREAIEDTLTALDSGALRVAERQDDGRWHVNQWAKKAVLLGFRLKDMELQDGSAQGGSWWDKVDSKWKDWDEARWRAAGFRAVPNCVVRRSAYIAPGVVLMPSFVNLGAYVDSGTMVDTWATVGSCAQIGKNVHLSGGVGIGGVLEPMQAGPTIIEDNCFIGARSEVVEGVGPRHGRLHRPVDEDRRPRDRRSDVWRGAALFGGRRRLDALNRRREPLLRRHREAGGRKDPFEDRDQRASARLNSLFPP
jgi:2,3,4,5-tetrahydropyridine-2-carboxylate N-succinyltransferase